MFSKVSVGSGFPLAGDYCTPDLGVDICANIQYIYIYTYLLKSQLFFSESSREWLDFSKLILRFTWQGRLWSVAHIGKVRWSASGRPEGTDPSQSCPHCSCLPRDLRQTWERVEQKTLFHWDFRYFHIISISIMSIYQSPWSRIQG